MALRTLEEEFAKMGLLTEQDVRKDVLGAHANEYDEDEYEYEEDLDDEDLDEGELEEGRYRFAKGSSKLVRKKTKSQVVKDAGGSAAYREGKLKAKKYRRTHGAAIKRSGRKQKVKMKRMGGLMKRRKAKAKESTSVDRLDVLLDELRTLNESTFDGGQEYEGDEAGDEQELFEAELIGRVLNIYGNLAVCADAVGTRLDEDDQLCEDLSELAEHAVQVCEGVAHGEIDPEVAAVEAAGYVKDLIEALGEVADELDEELSDDGSDEDEDEDYED